MARAAEIPPVSFGVWALLELADCDFLHPKKEATAAGAVLAAYIAAHGRHTIPLVADYVEAGRDQEVANLTDLSPDDELMQRAALWVVASGIQGDDFLKLRSWLEIGFAGSNMIPGGGGSGEFVFGMDSFGAMVAAVGSDMGSTADELMWDVPLCLVGHVIAQKSKQNGAKGVARPKDIQHFREQMAECERRKEAGLLYEWQEKEPWRYDLDGHENEDEAYRYAVLQHEFKYGKSEAS